MAAARLRWCLMRPLLPSRSALLSNDSCIHLNRLQSPIPGFYHTLQSPRLALFQDRRGNPFGGVPRRLMFIQTQTTPNPDAVMFLPGREIMPEGSAEFTSVRDASGSPLARRLFVIDGVRSVFFGGDFVTVTKEEGVDWKVLRPEIFEVLMDFFTQGNEPVVGEGAEWESDTRILDTDSEIVAMIKELLETRVKPAVAEDGGSILYRGFDEETGIVELELQGACTTCSSSSITLKNGVENMLRHYVPEVTGVREVKSAQTSEMERQSVEAFSAMERKLTESGILRS